MYNEPKFYLWEYHTSMSFPGKTVYYECEFCLVFSEFKLVDTCCNYTINRTLMCGNLRTDYDSAVPESRSALIRNAHGHYTANHINKLWKSRQQTVDETRRRTENESVPCPPAGAAARDSDSQQWMTQGLVELWRAVDQPVTVSIKGYVCDGCAIKGASSLIAHAAHLTWMPQAGCRKCILTVRCA